jgi:hypothetical protein
MLVNKALHEYRGGHESGAEILKGLFDSWQVTNVGELSKRLGENVLGRSMKSALLSQDHGASVLVQMVVVSHFIVREPGLSLSIPRGEEWEGDLDEVLRNSLGIRTYTEFEKQICRHAINVGYSMRAAFYLANGRVPSSNVASASTTRHFVDSLPVALANRLVARREQGSKTVMVQSAFLERRDRVRDKIRAMAAKGLTRSALQVESKATYDWVIKFDRDWFEGVMTDDPGGFRDCLRERALAARAEGLSRSQFAKSFHHEYMWLLGNDLNWFDVAYPKVRQKMRSTLPQRPAKTAGLRPAS